MNAKFFLREASETTSLLREKKTGMRLKNHHRLRKNTTKQKYSHRATRKSPQRCSSACRTRAWQLRVMQRGVRVHARCATRMSWMAEARASGGARSDRATRSARETRLAEMDRRRAGESGRAHSTRIREANRNRVRRVITRTDECFSETKTN